MPNPILLAHSERPFKLMRDLRTEQMKDLVHRDSNTKNLTCLICLALLSMEFCHYSIGKESGPSFQQYVHCKEKFSEQTHT